MLNNLCISINVVKMAEYDLLFLGFASLVISLSAVLVLNYFGKFPVKYITVNYLSLITAAVIFALLISIATLFISRKASSKEPSGNYVYINIVFLCIFLAYLYLPLSLDPEKISIL